MTMFCHKCGKHLAEGDKFCQFCGTKIEGEISKKIAAEPAELKRKDLEKKAWFRALKVLYIIVNVFVVLAIGAISWSAKPQKTIDGDKSTIVCTNGKSYAPNKNNIYIYSWETDLNYSDDKDARILCKYDTLNFYSHSSEFIEKNYTFIPVANDIEYGSWIGNSLIAYFILWLLAYLVKIGFFYIAIGGRPRWKYF